MNATDTSLLDYRHAVIRGVMDRFRNAKPDPEIQIILFPCETPALASARGFVGHGEERPDFTALACAWEAINGSGTGIGATESCAAPSLALRAPSPPPGERDGVRGHDSRETSLPAKDTPRFSSLQPVRELRVGDYIHIVVRSRMAGFLHLFNFGTCGDVAKLVRPSPGPALPIAADRWEFTTSERERQSPTDPRIWYRELGDGHGRMGRANGFPERLLVLVLKQNEPVRAGDLHPDWRVFDSRYRSVDDSGETEGEVIDESESEFETRHQPDEWGWGSLEVPVVNR